MAELSLEAQSKLLRVIQEQEFERVGSSTPIKVDIRLVTATHHDLLKRVEQGLFRMDLYYRLNVFPLHVPPLRERLQDIPLLVSDILLNLNHKLGKKIKGVSKQGMQHLMAYHWPGNVRELQNVIERQTILCHGQILQIPALQAEPQPQDKGEFQTLQQVEAAHIRRTLKRLNWRISGPNGAANLLGLPASTLRSRMLKLGIKRPA